MARFTKILVWRMFILDKIYLYKCALSIFPFYCFNIWRLCTFQEVEKNVRHWKLTCSKSAPCLTKVSLARKSQIPLSVRYFLNIPKIKKIITPYVKSVLFFVFLPICRFLISTTFLLFFYTPTNKPYFNYFLSVADFHRCESPFVFIITSWNFN